MCTEFNVQMTKPMPKQTVLQAQSALASAVSLNQMVSDRGTRLIIHSVGIPPLVFFWQSPTVCWLHPWWWSCSL